MKINLAQRLERVLMQDKSSSPQKLLPALKSDIREVIREYAELSSDITLEIQDTPQGYSLMLVAGITRFKA